MLAERWTTIAVEQQGHGHTADIDRPFSYEQMVEDTAALLRHKKIAGADVFGWSDGGIVALGLAARHPGLVAVTPNCCPVPRHRAIASRCGIAIYLPIE